MFLILAQNKSLIGYTKKNKNKEGGVVCQTVGNDTIP